MSQENIAIIGCGISGLVCARNLKERFNVTLFEKSRGVSGRTSTRYANEFLFNHGTPYFTAQSDDFQGFINQLISLGVVAQWKPNFMGNSHILNQNAKYYVGTPKMNDIAKYLADGLEIKLNTEIQKINYHDDGKISLTDKTNQLFDGFDRVVITAPPAQTASLLHDSISFKQKVQNAKMHGCYAVMIGTYQAISLHDSVYECDNHNIFSKIVIRTHKNNQTNAVYHQIVAYTQPDWSEDHINDDMQQAQHYLLNQLPTDIGFVPQSDDFITAHRWRYAQTVTGINHDFFYDTSSKTGICGDWCSANISNYDGVERAYISGKALAKFIPSY